MDADFTAQAEAYARARPGYPVALVQRLMARADVRAGDAVAEIGAGTGLLTQLLGGHGLRVTAIEPNAAMRQRAAAMADVAWRDGTFERTALAEASQKWVVAAQAFHWAQRDKALPEIRRVLQSGGHLTVLWNHRDHESDATVRWTRQAINRHVPDFTHAYRDENWAAALTSTGDFSEPVYDEEAHTVAMEVDRYLNLWRSHHRLNTIAGPQRFAALMEELVAYLRDQRVEQINVRYVTRAWTAQTRVPGLGYRV